MGSSSLRLGPEASHGGSSRQQGGTQGAHLRGGPSIPALSSTSIASREGGQAWQGAVDGQALVKFEAQASRGRVERQNNTRSLLRTQQTIQTCQACADERQSWRQAGSLPRHADQSRLLPVSFQRN